MMTLNPVEMHLRAIIDRDIETGYPGGPTFTFPEMDNSCSNEHLPSMECVIGNACFRNTLVILLYVCVLQHVLMIHKLCVDRSEDSL